MTADDVVAGREETDAVAAVDPRIDHGQPVARVEGAPRVVRADARRVVGDERCDPGVRKRVEIVGDGGARGRIIAADAEVVAVDPLELSRVEDEETDDGEEMGDEEEEE